MTIFRKSIIKEQHSTLGRTCHFFDQDTHLAQYGLRFAVFHMVMSNETDAVWNTLQHREYQERQYIHASHVRYIYQSYLWGISHFASLQNPSPVNEAKFLSLLLRTGELTHTYQEKIERGIQLFIQTADHLPLAMENLNILDEENFFTACMQLMILEISRQQSLPVEYRDVSIPEKILLHLETNISSDLKSFDWKNHISSPLFACIISELYQVWGDLDLSGLYDRGSIDADFVETLYQQGMNNEEPLCCTHAVKLAKTQEIAQRLIPLLCSNNQLEIAYSLLSQLTDDRVLSKSKLFICSKYIDTLQYEAAFQIIRQIKYDTQEAVRLLIRSLQKNDYPSIGVWNILERSVHDLSPKIQHRILIETYIIQEKNHDVEKAHKTKEKIFLLQEQFSISTDTLEDLLKLYIFTTYKEDKEKIETIIKNHFNKDVQKEHHPQKQSEYFNTLYEHAPGIFDRLWIDKTIESALSSASWTRNLNAILRFLSAHSLFQESWYVKIKEFYSKQKEKDTIFSLEVRILWLVATDNEAYIEYWMSSIEDQDEEKYYAMVKIFLQCDKLQHAKAYADKIQHDKRKKNACYKIICHLLEKGRPQEALEYMKESNMHNNSVSFDVGVSCILQRDFEHGIPILLQSLSNFSSLYLVQITNFEQKLYSSVFSLYQNNSQEEAWSLLDTPIYEPTKIAILIRLLREEPNNPTPFFDKIMLYLLECIQKSSNIEASNIYYQILPILEARFGKSRVYDELIKFFSITYHNKEHENIHIPAHLSFLQTLIKKRHFYTVQELLTKTSSNTTFHIARKKCIQYLAKEGQEISPYLSFSYDGLRREMIKDFAAQNPQRSFSMLDNISDTREKVLCLFDFVAQISEKDIQKANSSFQDIMTILLENKKLVQQTEEIQKILIKSIGILEQEPLLHDILNNFSIDSDNETIFPYIFALQIAKKSSHELNTFWKNSVDKARFSPIPHVRFNNLILIAKGIQKSTKSHLFNDIAVLLEEDLSQIRDRRIKVWATRDLCELYTIFGHVDRATELAIMVEKGRPRIHNSPLREVIRLVLSQKKYTIAEELVEKIKKTREQIPALLDIAEAYLHDHNTHKSKEMVHKLLRVCTHKNIQSKDLYRLSVLLFQWDKQEEFFTLFETLSDDECARTLASHISYDTDQKQQKEIVQAFFSRRRNETFLSTFIPQYIPKVTKVRELKRMSIYMPFDFTISRMIALQICTNLIQNKSWACLTQIAELCPKLYDYIGIQDLSFD